MKPGEPYTFVRQTEIAEIQGQPYKEAAWKLHELCVKLIAEREAYRNVCLKIIHEEFNGAEEMKKRVDAEAIRLLEKK